MRLPQLSFSIIAFIAILCPIVAHNTTNKHFYEKLKEILKTDFIQDDDKGPSNKEDKTRNNNIVANVSSIFEITTDRPIALTELKKWQVGRVSRKQYEIVNMLWRKTNIFLDIENTSPGIQIYSSTCMPNDKFSIPRPILQQSTASYIEFYYLDETDNRQIPKGVLSAKAQSKVADQKFIKGDAGDFRYSMSRSPFFAFRVNEPAYRRRESRNNPVVTMPKSSDKVIPAVRKTNSVPSGRIDRIMSAHNLPLSLNFLKNENSLPKKSNIMQTLAVNKNEDNISPYSNITTTALCMMNKSNISSTTINKSLSSSVELTTAYDRIKFFEIYDSNTRRSYTKQSLVIDDLDKSDSGNDINSIQKLCLEHIDQDIGQIDVSHKAKFVKKHVEDSENKLRVIRDDILKTYTKDETSGNVTFTQELRITNQTDSAPPIYSTISPNSSEAFKLTPEIYSNMSRTAKWSEYPFVAVYIYELYQVHCDAAVISPHWLIASGACLSRHREDPSGDLRSAFVTYCGDCWWNPERITYVKYTLIHPRFHPKDRARRQLYNIGAIQVVASMTSACNGWESISIMSHQFATKQEGSAATAVGWGLDRYDTRYASLDLPKHSLKAYNGYVYSDSCPGNSGYRKAKRLNEEGVKNVYCLLLPPYSGEERDPIHGGLLLAGGKLIALYLQEERRRWGDQSALYTGIWRLAPWISDVAREPEDSDFFV